jgi:conjugal transfer pilus assembly protein TraF
MFKLSLTLLTLLTSFDSSFAYSYRQECNDRNLGWNYYCDREIRINNKEVKKPKEINRSNDSKELTIAQKAKKIKEDIQKKEQELLDVAVYFPSEENTKNYIKFLQESISDPASTFASYVERTVNKNPDINYSLKRPVNNIGTNVFNNNLNQIKEQKMQNLNQKYGLFFIYRSDCPYCHAYAPVIKRFANNYNITIKAISMDGGILPEFPNSKINNGRFNTPQVPATILWDNQNKQATIIGYGAYAESELKDRIFKELYVKPEDNF